MSERFDRLEILIGKEGLKKLHKSHVMIFGIGGVGSWAAESIARTAVGKITLVDHDKVSLTNMNRQLPALDSTIDKSKVQVMAERMSQINPEAEIEIMEVFYYPQNHDQVFANKPDVVIDAIDSIPEKCHLLAKCHQMNIPVICSGGAGNKLDPTKIQIADLNKTHTDPLLQKVRKTMRDEHGFKRNGKMGIPCVFSSELPLKKTPGFVGTTSYVTGTFGLMLASKAIEASLEDA